MLIAVDHGNYSIKTPNFSFVAGLAEHTVPPPILDDCIEYDGRYWTLSESRIFYMRDKTQDDRYFILTLFAIAKELEKKRYTSPVVSVDLAVGLPPEHYGVLKECFAAYFKREKPVRFSYKGRQIMLSINRVLVFPQAYAAVALDSSSTIGYSRLFLIDIGGYTTDGLLLRNGKPDLQYCRSLECGIITMNNEIIRKINTLHDLHIDDEHISAVLLGEDTILPMDAQDTIRSATKVHAGNILNQLRELQFDLRSTPAMFIGGGSLLLRSYIESSPLVAKAEFVSSPSANVCGYEKLAGSILNQGGHTS